MPSSLPPLAIIAGPTASGKSALALELAERTGGVIVNADSAQIYRDLPILSAAPTAADLSRAEHRLYGMLDGGHPCSAAHWAAVAKGEIEEIQDSGRLPILAGGTGLYIRTLLDGIAPVPEIDPLVRAAVRAASLADNRTRLELLDPTAAERIKPADTTRTARSLEVVISTGRTLTQWQEQRAGGIGNAVQPRPLILLPPRKWLYERCDRRFSLMVETGAIEEVRRLVARGLDPDLPVMRAIGVAELGAFIRGEIGLEEAISRGQQATRRYAKRQYTWFSRQPPAEWPRFQRVLNNSGLAEALALLGG